MKKSLGVISMPMFTFALCKQWVLMDLEDILKGKNTSLRVFPLH
ncbi:MAG: hypothetical protein PHV76_02035 [Bacteroidales bacterium]|nr:hypothetical protein [Bacteroidales bacterium]